MVAALGLRTIDVPRNCADRQTVPAWQQVRDAVNGLNDAVIEYTENVKLRPGPSMRGLDARYSPVGLWNMNIAPGGSIVDLSGNGNNLVIETGTLRTSSLYPTIGGVLFDGATNLWCAGTPAVLQQLGAMSVVVQGMWSDLPTGGAFRTMFSHDAPGETSDTNYLYRGAFDASNQFQYFSEHGAGVNDVASTLSSAPRSQPFLLCLTRDASGNLRHGLNGLILGSPFGTVTLPTDGHNGHFRVGSESGGGNYFTGVILSVGVYPFVLSAAQFLDLYNFTMGPAFGYRQLTTVPDDLQPVFYADEDLELVGASMIPDSTSGNFPKSIFSSYLYRIDSSGSTATAALVASIDGNAASAQTWSPFRAQNMRLATTRPRVTKGSLLALSGKSSDWNGNLRLRLRRAA